jgi:chemotaxis-related protein WspB
MKVLVFHIGPDRYALRLRDIARVLPAAALKQIPLAPDYVAGLLDLHGAPVPVIDLSRLAGIHAEQLWFDSRIILIDYPGAQGADGATGSTHALGLLAEHVIGIDSVDETLLTDSGVTGAPFLGPVASGAGGLLQLVELKDLLPADVRALLFQKPPGATP